jgi:hypothetical protein
MFLSAECSLFRTEGFSCSLDVLYGVQGIRKYQFVSQLYISLNFWSSKPWIRIVIQPKMLAPDPKHWYIICSIQNCEV